ncbi:hypothetical protein BGX38DRAFT_1147240 [Terfezia claveryi]|nr:hypothetical protein BGX38DRAFT_1147240 [Terfezia claveryi]
MGDQSKTAGVGGIRASCCCCAAGMGSRKRAASQTIAPLATTKRSAPVQLRNKISFNNDIDDIDEIDNEGDRSSSESDEDENKTSTPTSVLAPGISKRTRTFAGEVLLLIENAWARAQIESRYLDRVLAVDCYLKSIHTRTRAHLVAECHSHIAKIYSINRLSKEEMKQKIEYLLDGDRFICRRAKQDLHEGRFRAEEIVAIVFQKYFEGAKRKGNREPNFLEKINGVFICFVATAIRHCLKAWKTGKYAESVQEFKYKTTWYISHGIAAYVKIVEIEPTDAPQPKDQEKYEAELEEELNHSYDRLNVPEIEMAEPLQPDLVDIYVDPDQTSDEHSNEEGGENEDESRY